MLLAKEIGRDAPERLRSGAGAQPRPARPYPLPEPDYHFLLNSLIDETALLEASRSAAEWGVLPHEVLIATGRLSPEDYYRALAKSCGVPFNSELRPDEVAPPARATPRQCLIHGLLKDRRRAKSYVLAPERLRPNALRALLRELGPYRFSLATPGALREAIAHHFAPSLAKHAVETLAVRQPDRSARFPSVAWQRAALILGVIAALYSGIVAPAETVKVLTLALALLFVPVVALRLVAVAGLLRAGDRAHDTASVRGPDRELPVYTILVPLYREAHMLPGLVDALARLDWPAPKLDIKLILEEVDAETVAAARALDLPSTMEIVVVPAREPRTKPKALNYALPLARGDYLVIYDAEDRPEPDQLRRAFAAFGAGPPNLATVQARLNLYNTEDNWLTRHFTIEYCALFDGLLPALDRLALPIPLGGTSNHFRVSALRWLLAWDPYNVTEDADLGMRLARAGYRCGVISSTTYEEAPVRFGSWLRQRTRWLKGFMQTWLVHMRKPRLLWRELGPRGFLAFQVMLGGTVLSALVHPWFYVLVAFELSRGGFLTTPQSLLGWPFWLIAWFSLAAGYLGAMALGLLTVQRRGYRLLLKQVPLMPVYWLLISLAAYRALWQYLTARFKWEKTEHGLARRVVLPPP